MYFTSEVSSPQALLNKTTATFLEGFFHATFLFCAPAAGGCAMALPTEQISSHPPALCSPVFLFFFFSSPELKLDYSRSVSSSSLRRNSVEIHTWKYDGGFPLPRASPIKAHFQSLLAVWRCVAEERGSYITFLFPFLTAAVVCQAAKLYFSLSRWFQRLSLGVALCSRGRVMQILERKEEQWSSG